jgi:hypothetical protein
VPVIIGEEDMVAWLGEEPIADPASLLKPFPYERITMWPVSKRVTQEANRDLIATAEENADLAFASGAIAFYNVLRIYLGSLVMVAGLHWIAGARRAS